MILDQINLNYLRIFESVYRTRSMTQTARELHLTQSGISQHIKSFEEYLRLKLFDRIKQKLVPTPEGEDLYKKIVPQLEGLELALSSITSKTHSLRGEVRLGVPVMFGLNMIIPKVTDFLKNHPDVQVRIFFELGRAINTMLLAGEVDFAFIDDFNMDPKIKVKKVYDECLKMCCLKSYYKSKHNELKKKSKKVDQKTFYESFDYISYQKGEPILRDWLRFHTKEKNLNLKARCCVGDALGVSHFVTNGLGVGLLPDHYINSLSNQGHDVFVFDTGQKNYKNKISSAFVDNRTQSLATQKLFKSLIQSF